MATVALTGERSGATSNVGSFVANLPELLNALARESRPCVVICEFDDERYVQFRIDPGGAIHTEVVSNIYLSPAAALDVRDEASLRSLGWHDPSPPLKPNWHFEVDDPRGVATIARMIAHTVLGPLGERPQDGVLIRSFAVLWTRTGRESVDEPSSSPPRNGLSAMMRYLGKRDER